MHLAIVETNMLAPVDDNVCRLYEVGRRRPNEGDSDIDDARSDSGDDDDDWDGGDDDEVSTCSLSCGVVSLSY